MKNLRGGRIAGRFCHAPVLGSLDIFEGVVEIDDDGVIASVSRGEVPDHGGRFILPGLVDLHIHAPQYPQLGRALNVPLERWLHEYTFPLEARFADTDFAARVYDALVGDLLALGTTTAVYYATVHQKATQTLVDACLRRGQRAFVGKVAMDHDCPAYYRDASAAAGLEGTLALIEYVQTHPDNDGSVAPIITPRFVPACSDSLLRGLGDLAHETGCHVQTHCSESVWEHAHVLHRFGRTDTEVLDHFGLLTRHSVLAHGTQLTDPDLDRIAARGSGIAHCPLSNAYFGNSVFPLRAALEKAVRVGLGTDISGGPSASMLDNCRMAVAASRMLEDGSGKPGVRISMAEAFHLATAGGADVLGLKIGRFEVGCHFDAMEIDPAAPSGSLRIWDEDEPESETVERVLYGASRGNISRVWVGGRRRWTI